MIVRVLILCVFLPVLLFSNEQDIMIMETLNNVTHSLDHLETLQSDIRIYKQSPEKITTVSYVYKRQDDSNIAAIVPGKKESVHIKNSRGYFFVYDGSVRKLDRSYPIEGPSDFLDQMDLSHVTENFILSVYSNTETESILQMIPVISNSQSIDEFMQSQVTMLLLTISKPDYLLTKVQVFNKHQLEPDNEISFDYAYMKNPAAKKRQFKHKYIKEYVPVMVHSYGVTRIKDEDDLRIHRKKVWFENIQLEVDFEEDDFDEESY
jgi:hypothetical protein